MTPNAPQLLSVEEARAAILTGVNPLGSQRCLLTEARGRYLAEAVESPLDAPAFDNSAMDGFAFCAADRGELLRLVGESAAGRPFQGEVARGQAVRIMTGAPMPSGADTVAMREICRVSGDELEVDWDSVRQAGDHVRRRGEYMRAHEIVLERGALLGPGEVALLASFGRTVVHAVRAPRVGILTTGTELVEPDRPRGAGQIYNSNAYMLEALVDEAGAVPHVAPTCADELEATRDALRQLARACDLVLTVGGVSVGDYDFVRQVLDEETGGMAFWKVRMKPGKPLAFGVFPGGVPVIGLPGNPVSSFVGFHQFVRPALHVMRGGSAEDAALRRLRLPTDSALSSPAGRREYVLGHIDPRPQPVFVPHPDPASANVLTMRACDALAIVEEGVGRVAAGDIVDVEIL